MYQRNQNKQKVENMKFYLIMKNMCIVTMVALGCCLVTIVTMYATQAWKLN